MSWQKTRARIAATRRWNPEADVSALQAQFQRELTEDRIRRLDERKEEMANSLKFVEGTFAPNNLDAYQILCPRCGKRPNVEWAEVSQFNDVDRWLMPTRADCETPGCVNEYGGNSVPLPNDGQGRRKPEQE